MAGEQKQPSAEMIEAKIDRDRAGSLKISASDGGVSFASMVEVMEFAKLMAIGGVALPAFLRTNVGACLAVCIQAIEWRMSPYAVANKSYCVNDRLCFESQLIHAVIEQRAPITGRLRHKFTGEGATRRCVVWASVRGESEPLEYTSPPFEQITPKNSPLWKSKPDLQLFYNASRDWARMYFPDVILGVYSDDEIDAVGRNAAVGTVSRVARTLDDLTAARTAADVEQPEPEAEPKSTDAPSPSQLLFEEFAQQVAGCATRKALEAVDIPSGLTDEQNTRACALIDEKIKALAAARGSK